MPGMPSPPRLARWLLQWALTGPTRSAIVGDIEEEFARHVAPRLDPRSARRWYWRQTLLSIAACVRGPDAPDGGRARLKEPRMSLSARFEEVRDDAAGALRQMRRAPAFTALAATTLALGHRRQQRHLRARRRDAAPAAARARARSPRDARPSAPTPERPAGSRRRTSSTGAARTRTFENLAGFVPHVGAMVMAGADGTAENVSRQWVAVRVLRRLRRAAAGRPHVLGPADEVEGAPDPRSSSARRSGGRASAAIPTVVGRVVRLDGEPYTIVGVVPPRLPAHRAHQPVGRRARSSTTPASAATTSCRRWAGFAPGCRSTPPAPTWRPSPRASRASSRPPTPAGA